MQSLAARGIHMGKNPDRRQLEHMRFLAECCPHPHADASAHPAHPSGAPVGPSLSFRHQFSLWESVFGFKILSVALDHIVCLVMTF